MCRPLQWRPCQSPPGGATWTGAPWTGGSVPKSPDLSKIVLAVEARGFTNFKNSKKTTRSLGYREKPTRTISKLKTTLRSTK